MNKIASFFLLSMIAASLPDAALAQFRPKEPAPFLSTPNQTAQFQLTRTETSRAITKSFQGGNPPYTQEIALDHRLVGRPEYYGTPTRETSNWSFIAVRTAGNAKVSVQAIAYNRWNIYHPRSLTRLSRNGFDIVFKWGVQELSVYSTGGNFSGNANRCGQGPDTLQIPDFSIPLDLFEKMDNIEIRPRAEAYYGCPISAVTSSVQAPTTVRARY